MGKGFGRLTLWAEKEKAPFFGVFELEGRLEGVFWFDRLYARFYFVSC